MTTKRKFLKEFWKDKQMVGAICPSTRFLGEKMIENVDFDKARMIVELGPGTGCFTGLILNRMHRDAKLLVFELNDSFYQNLAKRFDDPRVQIIHDSAEKIADYTDGKKVDAVISSLPLMVFSEELRNNVVNAAYDSLKKDGKYMQFQYSLQSKKLLQSVYKTVSVKFTMMNLPPAFVYTCSKI